MTDRELMQQAIEALEFYYDQHGEESDAKVIIALRERLAQPQRTHWEGCEEVHPECRKQEAVAHSIVAGALFDFMGWLTSRRERLVLSSIDNAGPAADAIKDFAQMRSLSINDAQVQEWQEHLTTAPPRREWVGLTDDEIAVICGECAASAHRTDDISYARAIEAKLKEKNNG